MPTITEIVETDSEAHDVRRAPQGVSPEEHRLARRMFLADVSDDDEGEVSGLDDLGTWWRRETTDLLGAQTATYFPRSSG